MLSIKQEIIERIDKLNEEQQRQVLALLRSLEAGSQERTYSARELMQMPPQERQRLVADAFALAADEDFETFEAYSEEEPDASA